MGSYYCSGKYDGLKTSKQDPLDQPRSTSGKVSPAKSRRDQGRAAAAKPWLQVVLPRDLKSRLSSSISEAHTPTRPLARIDR